MDAEIEQKRVKIAESQAEALKVRQIKRAEGDAQTQVLMAKAESDSMQYTLPLKQKQIEQSSLEAEARKEATIENAEAAAQAKVIDSKAEQQRETLLADAEANRIRVTAKAQSEEMQMEAAALKLESAARAVHGGAEAFGQGADHAGAERRKIFLHQRCAAVGDGAERSAGGSKRRGDAGESPVAACEREALRFPAGFTGPWLRLGPG